MKGCSLGTSNIGILDIVVLKHLVPEAGQLMTVADLYHMELLDDAAVESKFLLLEFRDHLVSQVVSHQTEQNFCLVVFSVSALYLAGHVSHIVGILEKGSHRFLALVDCLNVFLG